MSRFPLPMRKGAAVVGGTINKTGAFTFRATKVGHDMVISQIIRMVQDAQADKLPIQAMVDKVTGWFVPAVMVAAAITLRALACHRRHGHDGLCAGQRDVPLSSSPARAPWGLPRRRRSWLAPGALPSLAFCSVAAMRCKPCATPR